MDEVKHAADSVSKLSADRLSILEQALPLATHFTDTHEDLLKWFGHAETDLRKQDAPALNTDQIKQQQDLVKVNYDNVMLIYANLC